MELAARLGHVRWIGGGSGAGKSTIATRLAAQYHLRLHPTEPISRYVARTNPKSAPMLHRFLGMDTDERWVRRSPQEMYETFHGFHGECFDLIVQDVLNMPTEPPILVEGFMLLPRLVMPLLTHRHQAVWLLPSAAFRRAAFDSRGTTWHIARQTSNPARALANQLQRDHLFTQQVASEAHDLDAQVITMRRGTSSARSAARVAAALALDQG